tara:strand:+ start:469 stop:795 length:327 start_codon:yes stop_codon:yes gene_type:complete
MAHISNLCKLLPLVLILNFCAPAHAQPNNPSGFNWKHIRVICSQMQPFLDYARQAGFEMEWMGGTSTNDVQDSLWINDETQEFLLMRFTYYNNEACMISSGSSEYFIN